jgi:transcriptional regulator PpsR
MVDSERRQAPGTSTSRDKAPLGGGFSSPQTALGDLDAGSAAALIAAASDLTLIVDAAGLILDLSIQNEELARDLDGGHHWVGNPLASTVSADSRPKVAALMQDAMRSETRWRHINHLDAEGRSVPVTYCCVQLGQEGRMVVFGRDLRALSALQQRLMNAQATLEQDYSRLRDAEMRYRLLFQTSSEAVLIVDQARGRVVEANPAAREMLGAELRDIVGHALLPRFAEQDAVNAYLNAVRGGETPEDLTIHLVHARREVVVRATAFRQDAATMLLVRVSSAHAVAAATTLSANKSKLLRAVESAPDGFVVTDADGTVLTANAAFVEMAGVVAEEAARGQSLDNWVGESGVDMTVLIANLRQRGVVRFFSTTLRNESGAVAQVEISAVAIDNGKPSFGFAIRNVGPRVRTDTKAARALPRSVEQLQELIGRVALKELVREATEVIERLSIEAALELTNDNRASAAEMLGLSRQSLYVKLRRYGLGDLDPAERD